MKETVTDFLNRGGNIQRFEMVKPEENKQLIYVKPITADRLDLADGAFFFSEDVTKSKNLRKSRKKTKTSINIDETLLPKSLLDLLKSMESHKDEELNF